MLPALQLLVQLLLAALGLPLLLGCLYLLLLSLLSATPRPPPRSSRRLHFDILVPAHNEAAVIGRLLASLQRLDWPAAQRRVLVVCDNCSDATPAIAGKAGACVLLRRDPSRRGKGYALQFGFDASRRHGWADAVVVVDADSEVSPGLLEACAARIEQGAAAVQVHYGVLNPRASHRTRLMTLAFSCIHRLRSRARERLRLSCGIRGNGWCVTQDLLRQVPYQAYSLAEDVEYGLALGLAGCRVAYADEAEVRGEMTSGEAAARSQRRRWEGGRWMLVRSLAPPLLRAALRADAVCLDLLLDLLLPPLSWLALGSAALSAAALAGAWLGLVPLAWPVAGAIAILALALYVARGWQLSGLGAEAAASLLRAPAFVLWKLRLMLSARIDQHWIRTQRERT